MEKVFQVILVVVRLEKVMSKTDIHLVAAVIVTFYPDDRFFKLLSFIRPQVDVVWVIDNGSRGQAKNDLEKLQKDSKKPFNIILNNENIGLAAAQNQGIKQAIVFGYDWVLLLDQDSLPAEDMVDSLMNVGTNYNKKEKLGLLTPRHEDDNGNPSIPTYSVKSRFGLRRYFMTNEEVDDTLAFGMSSGSLIPSEVFKNVGMMKEDFWIDYIDYDFSFRIRKMGYQIIGVGCARLKHRLGENHTAKIISKTFTYRAHPAFRRYTIYRNRIRVIRQYGLHFPNFLLFELLSISKDFLKLIFIEQNKLPKLLAIFHGILDGVLGKGGLKNLK
jgi:GT2 family glycosyltransferase